MVICPSCRSQQMNGTLFCGECGSDLQAPAVPTLGLEDNAEPSVASRPSVKAAPPAWAKENAGVNVPSGAPMPPKPRSAPPPITSQPPARRATVGEQMRHDLRVLVLNTGRIADCPDKENIIIGRSDAITGDVADIDLAADNALGLGVSRRHACINFRNGLPYLTDLGSLNRTWLNRQIMMRGQPYQLKDGDEIRLGNAILKIMYNP